MQETKTSSGWSQKNTCKFSTNPSGERVVQKLNAAKVKLPTCDANVIIDTHQVRGRKEKNTKKKVEILSGWILMA